MADIVVETIAQTIAYSAILGCFVGFIIAIFYKQ